jgi:hypothetical protein
MPALADLVKLFAEKSIEDRLKEAVSVRESAVLLSLWLEKNAMERAVHRMAQMEEAVDSAELDDVYRGVELAHQELAKAAQEMRSTVNLHLDKKELIKCRSKSALDLRQRELWNGYCDDVDGIQSRFNVSLNQILQGQFSEQTV